VPNIDGGHYFLTVLVPIHVRDEVEGGSTIETPANNLRKLLSLMPTIGSSEQLLAGDSSVEGVQPPATSPFARNRLNHFVRFAVIDAINYNGRINGDGLVEAIRKINPAICQPFDRLSRPFLLFAAEFDPNPHGAPEPDVYLDKLWDTMKPELELIFGHCFGFSGVKNAGDFVRYIRSCQIETTMPFNDYWTGRAPLKSVAFWPLLGVGLAAGVASGFLAGKLLGLIAGSIFAWIVATIVGLVVAVALILFVLVKRGARPFPTAPNSTLERVLKALYLQDGFIDFAVAHQSDDPSKLYNAFAKFLAERRPSAHEPTQPPAVIGA
jgi:hypothetical protein